MRIVGTLLLVFSLTIAQLAFDFWWRKHPLRVTTTVDFGKQNKDAPKADPDKPGYVGMKIANNKVDCIYTGSPADQAGLLPGDQLLDVNDGSVLTENAEKISGKLRGDIGTAVNIVYLRDGKVMRAFPVRAVPVAEEAREIAADNERKNPKVLQIKGLTENDLSAMPLKVSGHPVKFIDGDVVAGGTRVRSTDPDEDNLKYWIATREGCAVGDLNSDGIADGVVAVRCDNKVHLIPVLSKDGVPTQTGDTIIADIERVESPRIDNQLFRYTTTEKSMSSSFEAVECLVDGHFIQPTNFYCMRLFSESEVPLVANNNDVILPQVPLRIADMTSKNFAIKTGIKAEMLTKDLIQKALSQEQKRLGIEAGRFGDCGTIKAMSSGDFTGDGAADAAVVVATARADSEQLDLVAAGIENGQITLYGAIPLGDGGVNTWNEEIKVESGKIGVNLSVGGRDEPPPQDPAVSWHFKVNQGKLIKCL